MSESLSLDRQAALDAFSGYVSTFDPSNPRISLKIDHTLRVASLCDRIASELGLSPSEQDRAWLIGLLHDIGRFEQVRQFDTFNDAASVDHASFGARLLFDGDSEREMEPLIRRFLPQVSEDSFIRAAIEMHSAYRIPERIKGIDRTLCTILRDADKIDILSINGTTPVYDIYRVTDGEMSRSEVSLACVEIFYEHRCIPRGVRTYPADILLGHICFGWELVHDASRDIAREQGHLRNMLLRTWDNAATAQAFSRMADHMIGELAL